jgi:hypothetical protein
MPILVRMAPLDLTLDKYHQVNSRLGEKGVMPPDGLEYHVCFGEDGDLRISEVWSSQEQFQAFGEHLLPILADAGIELSQPQILPVHNQIRP